MKANLKIFVLMLLCCIVATRLVAQNFPNEYMDAIHEAEGAFKDKDYKKAAQSYSKALKMIDWENTLNDRYNAARAWALAKMPDSAFTVLEKIADRYYFSDREHVSADDDFKPLHIDKRWQPLLDKIEKNKEVKLPEGWYRSGSKPSSYFIGIDKGAGMNGRNVATIKSLEEQIDGFGTLMQDFMPEKYLGKRIRMTGYMKTKDVKQWAGFWMRIDRDKESKPYSFDNMKEGKKDRSIKGTNDWTKYEIVLDVADNATNLAFGVVFFGTGQVWFDKITFEVVDYNVPTTGYGGQSKMPLNLDFGN